MDTWMYIVGGIGIVVSLGGGAYLGRIIFRRGKKKGEFEARVRAEMAAEEAQQA